MTTNDLFWLAGLLEGEGCFTTKKNWYKDHWNIYPRVILKMCDRDVVEKAANLFDAKVYCTKVSKKNPKHRDNYQFELHGKQALDLMKQVYPYMGERRQARIRELGGVS